MKRTVATIIPMISASGNGARLLALTVLYLSPPPPHISEREDMTLFLEGERWFEKFFGVLEFGFWLEFIIFLPFRNAFTVFFRLHGALRCATFCLALVPLPTEEWAFSEASLSAASFRKRRRGTTEGTCSPFRASRISV